MIVEIKKLHPDAVVPKYQTKGAAAIDLHACIVSPMIVRPQAPAILIPTGIAVWIRNPNYVGLMYPRSGNGHKLGMVLGNGTGVIDSDYQGPLSISVWNRNPPIKRDLNDDEGLYPNDDAAFTINPGDRIAQLVFTRCEQVEFFEVKEFKEDSDRGAGGFGSTGK
jgi:dUTP pyrophosphatase